MTVKAERLKIAKAALAKKKKLTPQEKRLRKRMALLEEVAAYLEKKLNGVFVIGTLDKDKLTSTYIGKKTGDIEACYLIDSLAETRNRRNH